MAGKAARGGFSGPLQIAGLERLALVVDRTSLGGLDHGANSIIERIVEIAGLNSETCCQRIAIEIADLTVHFDVAEVVALTLFHHIGDDEVLLVGRKLCHRGYDPEISIALGKIELTQFLSVELFVFLQ